MLDQTPTVEPITAQVKPARTNANQRREAQGYKGPKERAGCAGCNECSCRVTGVDTPFEKVTLYCQVGEFTVQKGGFCAHWRAAR